MSQWALAIGWGIAYFGGSMAAIVYNDAKDQGRSKLIGRLYALGIAIVSCIAFTLLVTLVK